MRPRVFGTATKTAGDLRRDVMVGQTETRQMTAFGKRRLTVARSGSPIGANRPGDRRSVNLFDYTSVIERIEHVTGDAA